MAPMLVSGKLDAVKAKASIISRSLEDSLRYFGNRLRKGGACALALTVGMSSVGCRTATADQSVFTYHNDTQRTGWNSAEVMLTPENVNGTTFGLLAKVRLDDSVDAQPLVVASQAIGGGLPRTVVYVATESNTIYAIDAETGAILKTTNLGAPVPNPQLCDNNPQNIGVTGTPTIDLRTRTMFVIAYVTVRGKPTYQLHALDLGTLGDRPNSPVTVAATHPQPRIGGLFTFDGTVQRQRAALLQANGNVYAAFASYCDHSADRSRGWVLGWNAATLKPMPSNELSNTISSVLGPVLPLQNYFLSSIWMSGYGIAADASGALFFTTGNSAPRADTYTGTSNIQESAVKVSGNLGNVDDLFTPSNEFSLDQTDNDFGSGGIMVLPDQPGDVPRLAVAAGKDGRMFILNRDSMGKFKSVDVPGSVNIGSCWCGPSYFRGSDGIGRVISSGGARLAAWKVTPASAASPNAGLELEASAESIFHSPQDGGFFSSVSSNGSTAHTAIIWAVGRPDFFKVPAVPNATFNPVNLYAFDATASGTKLTQIWTDLAGFWGNPGGNANIVPTVANGRVYVATTRQLAIFGLHTRQGGQLTQSGPVAPQKAQNPNFSATTTTTPPTFLTMERTTTTIMDSGPRVWGTIRAVSSADMSITLRDGEVLRVDNQEAIKNGTAITPQTGMNIEVTGQVRSDGVFQASAVSRAKGVETWGTDRVR